MIFFNQSSSNNNNHNNYNLNSGGDDDCSAMGEGNTEKIFRVPTWNSVVHSFFNCCQATIISSFTHGIIPFYLLYNKTNNKKKK